MIKTKKMRQIKKVFANKFYDSSKLVLIKEIHLLVNQYFKMVSIFPDIFLTNEERLRVQKEIEMLESLIQSKMKISSLMRGF